MIIPRCLTGEFMIYEFEQSHNATESTKTICCMKDEGAIDHSNQIASLLIVTWTFHGLLIIIISIT